MQQRSEERPRERPEAKGRLPLGVKKVISRTAKALTLPTSPLRALPDYLIIGTQRGGTTSLYNYLVQHPQVYPLFFKKGIHFFDTHYSRGFAWYRSHFPTVMYRQYVKKARGYDLLAGEGSPYYIFHPHAPLRIAERLPHVKLIAMLRDPVERAFSHYQHEVARGFETLPFEEAIEREPERMDGELERMKADPSYYSFSHQHHTYLARGLYVEQLQVWHSLFPREQMLILKSEDFFSDTDDVFKQVLRFLGLPGWSLPSYARHNARRYAGLNEQTRRRLAAYFTEPNRRLYEYLGVDLRWEG